jgi:hypothetical protein
MKRRTLDKIISIVSLGFAALLLLFAGLLNWGASFADENVASQLAMQNISFPAVESLPVATKDQLTKWADQKVMTGEMARDYSDLYILEHMNASATAVTGKPATYSEVSGVYMGLVRGGSTDVEKIKQYVEGRIVGQKNLIENMMVCLISNIPNQTNDTYSSDIFSY